jgi:hypothetical protein
VCSLHRENFDDVVTRAYFVTAQDVRNRTKRFLHFEMRRADDDTLSLHRLVSELQAEPRTPVLFYKAPGHTDTSTYGFSEDQLALVLATQFQLEQFAQHVIMREQCNFLSRTGYRLGRSCLWMQHSTCRTKMSSF